MEESQSWSSYRGVIRRRKRIFFLVSVPMLVLAVLTAFLLPPVYKASARVLIEEQQIPADFVKTTVTSFVEERIEQITQQVMSRSTLIDIVRRFNLYADRIKREPMDEIIERMRQAIELKTVSAETPDKRTGRPSSVTVAFTISYEGEEPGKVQKVTDTLASLYLNENLKAREQRASTTTAFLQQELEAVSKQTQELEARISAFKRAHPGELPEYNALNLQTMERAERDSDNLGAQIRAAEERKAYLAGQLAAVDPVASGPATKQLVDPKIQLRQLRLKLTLLRGTVSDDHPDVKSLGKEIRELEAQVGPVSDSAADRAVQIASLKDELAKKQRELGPKHPDVTGLSRKLAEAEKEAANPPPPSPEAGEVPNPAYVALKTQLASTEFDIRSLGEQRRATEAKLRQYRERLARAPAAEQEYAQLTQGYQSAKGKYDELLKKLMEAKVAQGMEESQRGERFTIIDPAEYPERPFRPNRLAICLIGFVLALGAGIGAGAAQESLDTSLKSPGEVQEVFGLPVLSVFPYVGDAEKPRRRAAVLLSVLCVIGVAVVGLILVHFFVAPLDVMWFRVLRKLG